MSQGLKFLQQFHSTVASYFTPTSQKLLESPKLKNLLFLNFLNFYSLLVLFFANFFGILFCSSFTWLLFLSNFVLTILMTTAFLLTCRTSPQLYQIINACLLSISGPVSLLISTQSLFFAMTISFLAPPIILFMFREQKYAYISFVLQYIFLNLFYFPAYKRALMIPSLNDISHIAEQNFSAFNFIYLSNALILYAIYSISKNTSSSSTKHSGSETLQSQAQVLRKFSFTSQSMLNNMITNLDVAELEENPLKSKILLANAKLYGDLLRTKVDTIVDVEKTQTNNFQINKIPERVTDFLERLWSTSSELIKKKGLFGTITMHKTLPPILSLDHQRLFQVILNILINSVRFTEKGSIDISINWLDQTKISDSSFEPIPFDEEGGIGEAKTNSLIRPVGRGRIEESVYVLDTHQKKFLDVGSIEQEQIVPKQGILKIVISDTGCGMTEKELEEIFNLSPNDIENKDQQSQPCKGFNLWMTKQLVEKMDGKIRLYSKPGKGTICILCIKAEVPPIEQIKEGQLLSSKEAKSSYKTIRGIVIDENSYSLDAVKGYLEKGQVDVIAAVRNVNEAIEIYEKDLRLGKNLQLITINAHDSLTDAKMICDSIRQFENSQNVQPCGILILAESYFESQLKECLDPQGTAKASAFLQLPIYFPELQKLLVTLQSSLQIEPQEPFHPSKVLIVDDLVFNLQLLERYLEMGGHEFIGADNGEKAVEVYKENWKDIAVIFMDCQMPILDGYDATKQIRKFQQEKKIPKIKIFGVTGNVGRQYDEECKEAGMNGKVPKPVPRDEFERIVVECLHDYQ